MCPTKSTTGVLWGSRPGCHVAAIGVRAGRVPHKKSPIRFVGQPSRLPAGYSLLDDHPRRAGLGNLLFEFGQLLGHHRIEFGDVSVQLASEQSEDLP